MSTRSHFTAEQLSEQIALFRKVRATVAQSREIHPDWELEEHLSYLENDAFLIDGPETLMATPGSFNGPETDTAERFVAFWLRRPEQLRLRG